MAHWLHKHDKGLGKGLLKWLVLDKASLHVLNHGSPLPLGWPFPASFNGLVRYGVTVSKLQVEKVAADRRRVFVEVELEGETRPLTVTLDYRIERFDSAKGPEATLGVRLFIEKIAASRPWLQKIVEQGAADFLPDGYRIPPRLLTKGGSTILDYLDLL